ncbi:phosphotransferase family protein [Actinoplanes couchii]|uniref:Aminoglycoside phosphotransferase domain-containing protein n=1 Tax=Actinoplanes couchii TaxID=403638 RepID=A0ABQ3XN95_9ACTN|nr:aminoglycoside phosphotransferase family protein [Actinoplanes couchii]MDR6318121.1 aminoglycoside phosphotransferase (APT) family kinase protein [Actinoplanes couchii]GID59963.1 hypothetical protein Aco03nite_083670 [Actinoplanes couchii]
MTRPDDIDAAAVGALLGRIFGRSVPVTWRRTPDGVSTPVYRIERGPEVFYLRVAEGAGENLETDAVLHRRLRALGVQVADVVHVEPFDAGIGRSVMVTTEVPGVPVGEIADPVLAASVVERAGADLAVINRIPVDGFGFVRRDGSDWPLHAEYPRYDEFLVSYLPQPWPGPLGSLFDRAEIGVFEDLVSHERAARRTAAVLSHGDFDLTQIFCAAGRYTGLIDFGEIRGTDPLFDLGHFHLWNQESSPALLRGYQRVQPLPPGYEDDIRHGAILLALRQLCRWLGPPLSRPLAHPAITHRTHRIRQLMGGVYSARGR